MKLVKVFGAGLIISFAGSLPLGMLNVAALQLSISDGYGAAFWFVGGCTVVEMVYVWLSLLMMERIMRHTLVLKALKWVSLILLLALSLQAFIVASKGGGRVPSVLANQGLHPFIVGIMLMAVNPVQIPFWFGWNTILYSRNILVSRRSHYMLYPIGIGLGSLLGSAVFIYGGQVLFRMLKDRQNILNWSLGFLFLVFAFAQLRKIIQESRSGVPSP
jgi:threonine/homoserine/homoserine lactone efflux protein